MATSAFTSAAVKKRSPMRSANVKVLLKGAGKPVTMTD